MSSKVVVVGIGLIGIQVLEELIESGVNPYDITVIDPNASKSQIQEVSFSKSRELRHIYNRNKVNDGLSKKELGLKDLHLLEKSQTYYWGASCLPPIRFEIPNSGYGSNELRQAYGKVTESIGVQATYSSFSERINFPYTEEVIGRLPRKQLANEWVNASNGNVYHSRLAISTSAKSGCSFQGNCFEGCPNNSIWNPSNHVSKVKEALLAVKYLDARLDSIDLSKHLVVTSNGDQVKYERLILTAGPNSTAQIVSSVYPDRQIKVKTSPVVLLPFIVRKCAPMDDFKSHFVTTDLLVPSLNENGLSAITQIYLPTSEIAGRVLLQAPRMASELLLRMPSKSIEYLMRHIGIAMVFAPGYESDVNPKKVRRIMKDPIAQVRKVLAQNGAELLLQPRRYILNHDSHHSGSIYEMRDGITNSGLNSRVYSSLRDQNVHLLDSSLLPQIPPGPHTLTAASLARLEIRRHE
jgi:hypothetical protein